MLRSILGAVVQWIARGLSWASHKGLRTFYPTRHLFGLQITCVDDDASTQEVLFNRITEALALLEGSEPRRLAHLRRDVHQVFVSNDHASAFQRPGRVIYLNATDVTDSSVGRTACTLVALGTYARFESRVPRSMLNHRLRVLRSGHEQQVVFATTLPDGETVISELSRAWDEGWWGRDDRSRTYHSLKRRGTPKWALATLRKIYGEPSDAE